MKSKGKGDRETYSTVNLGKNEIGRNKGGEKGK